jgi:autotransporter-associated beta strand protein
VTVNGGTLTIGSIDADTTARTLQKAGGGGTLAITGAAGANFQGGFTLNGGTLLLGNKDALGTGTIIGQSGTLQASANLSGANKLPNALTLTALTVSGTNNIELGGKLSGLSGGDRTLTSSITGSAGLTLNAVDINTSTTAAQALIIAGTGLTTVNGVIANGGTQAHKLTITSTGTVTLNGANTFTGLLYVNGNNTTTVVNLNGNNIAATGGVMWEKGKLNINSPTALGTGTFSNLGGSTMGLDNTSGAPVVLTTNNLISLTEQFTFSTNTGTTNNNLTFGTGDVNFPNSRQYTMNGAGVLTFGGNLVNTGAGNRQLTVNNGATTTTFGSMNFGGLVITGTGAGPTARVFTISGSGKVGFNGAITDGIVAGGSLLYNGTGTLTLNAASTFTGGFTQNAATGGIVQIGSDTAVGTGTLTFNSGNGAMQAVGGTRTLANNISFSNTNATFSGTNNFVFNGTAAWNGSNNLTVNNPMTTFNGTFTLRSDGSIAQRTVTFNGTGQTVMNGAILNGSTTNGIVQLS